MDAHSLNAMQDDLQLVSTPSQFPDLPRTASRPISTESNVNVAGEERLPQSFPSPEQQVALSVLKDFDEDTVLDWLKLLRSIEPGFQFRSRPGCLTVEQLNALNSLKDCENSHVLAGLRHTLLGGIQESCEPLGYHDTDDSCRKCAPRTYVWQQPLYFETVYHLLISIYAQEFSKVKPEIFARLIRYFISAW